MRNFVFMWEAPNGERYWETVKETQLRGFLRKLLNDGVHPATVMASSAFFCFDWVWKKYHNGSSSVCIEKIDEEIYGMDPRAGKKHEPVAVPESMKIEAKLGWLAPDGRFFGCGYGEHKSLARRIVGEIQDISDPEKHLERLGWAKIMRGLGTWKRYAIGMGVDKKLTDAQLQTLQRMGLDSAQDISCWL